MVYAELSSAYRYAGGDYVVGGPRCTLPRRSDYRGADMSGHTVLGSGVPGVMVLGPATAI